jgi:hypothetical protein
MLRWFYEFDHIVFYITVKLFILSLVLMVMWMMVHYQMQIDNQQLSLLMGQFA